MTDLLEAGVHFGHQTKRWNPKMKQYIFGERNGIYILDLGKTVKLFREAEEFVTSLATTGRTVLFVGTKRQAKDVVAEEALRCASSAIASCACRLVPTKSTVRPSAARFATNCSASRNNLAVFERSMM